MSLLEKHKTMNKLEGGRMPQLPIVYSTVLDDKKIEEEEKEEEEEQNCEEMEPIQPIDLEQQKERQRKLLDFVPRTSSQIRLEQEELLKAEDPPSTFSPSTFSPSSLGEVDDELTEEDLIPDAIKNSILFVKEKEAASKTPSPSRFPSPSPSSPSSSFSTPPKGPLYPSLSSPPPTPSPPRSSSPPPSPPPPSPQPSIETSASWFSWAWGGTKRETEGETPPKTGEEGGEERDGKGGEGEGKESPSSPSPPSSPTPQKKQGWVSWMLGRQPEPEPEPEPEPQAVSNEQVLDAIAQLRKDIVTGNLPVSSSSISLVGHIPSAMPVTAASMPPMAPAAAPPPPPPPPPPPGPGGPKMSFKLKTKSEGVKKEEKKEEEEERKDETPEEKEERLKKEKEAEMKKKEAEMKKKRENLLRNLRMCLVGSEVNNVESCFNKWVDVFVDTPEKNNQLETLTKHYKGLIEKSPKAPKSVLKRALFWEKYFSTLEGKEQADARKDRDYFITTLKTTEEIQKSIDGYQVKLESIRQKEIDQKKTAEQSENKRDMMKELREKISRKNEKKEEDFSEDDEDEDEDEDFSEEDEDEDE